MHSLAQRVLSHIRRQELLKAGDRAGVAVSGGIDSVALLRLMLELRGELGIVLSVVHFNHKLRGSDSYADEQFVASLAREHDLEFFADSDDVAGVASEEHVSVETAARDVRYGFFRYLLSEDGGRQGLKPQSGETPLRGPEGPLFHGPAKVAMSPIRVYSGFENGAPSNPTRRLDKIATGHTLDDQAETVLMRMIRGAGTGGLGGIYPRIVVEDDDGEACGEIVRPLLAIRRRELKAYLFDLRQDWREDSTNADASFTRNRVRKVLVPLLEKEFNPAAAENLAELAEIARGEEDYWENEVAGWVGTAVHWSKPEWARTSRRDGLVQIEAHESGSEPNVPLMRSQQSRTLGTARSGPSTGKEHPPQDDSLVLLQSKIEAAPWLVMNGSVDRLWFLGEPVAVQRRVIKAIGEQAGIPLEFKHVEEILRFALEEKEQTKSIALPRGWKVSCKEEEILFLTPDLRQLTELHEYEYDLSLPGQVTIEELGMTIEAREISTSELAGYNSERLLDAESVRRPLRARNWRAGDRFWPSHTKSPKKIKALLQERRVPPAERKLWPVVLSGDEIVWMRGFPAPAKLQAKPGRPAVLIQEMPLAESRST